MGLFKKKKGGTFVGNMLAKVANKATGGILGSKRTSLLDSGQIDLINSNATASSKLLMSIQPETGSLTDSLNTEGYKRIEPIKTISTDQSTSLLWTPSEPPKTPLRDAMADKIRDFVSKATTNPDGSPVLRTSNEVNFGTSNNLQPILLIGLAILGFTLINKR